MVANRAISLRKARACVCLILPRDGDRVAVDSLAEWNVNSLRTLLRARIRLCVCWLFTSCARARQRQYVNAAGESPGIPPCQLNTYTRTQG